MGLGYMYTTRETYHTEIERARRREKEIGRGRERERKREREKERERVRESYRNTRSLPGAKLQLFRLRVRLLVGFPGLLPLLWRSLLRDCIG